MPLMPPWSLAALPDAPPGRFPCIREYVLLLLDLQLVGKFGHDVIYQLVVRQGAQRIDVHIVEYLIVDIVFDSAKVQAFSGIT